MTEEQIMAVNREIWSRVPQQWKDNLTTVTQKYQVMLKVLNEALDSPDFPEEKKEDIRLQRDLLVDKKQITENTDVQRKIDNFLNREQKKAVKEGRLPTKKRLAELKIEWQKQKEK